MCATPNDQAKSPAPLPAGPSGRVQTPPEPAIRRTSTLCGLIAGTYAGLSVGTFVALLLSLPIAMTYPLAQSPWAPALETTIWCVAALIALAILVKITALARKAGDHLARKIGPTRARLVATAVIVLALANIAARVETAL